jgi:hypothetical protein
MVLDKARSNLPDKPLPPKKTGAAVAGDDDLEPCKVVRSGTARVVSGKNAPKGKVSFLTFYKSGYLQYVLHAVHKKLLPLK